MVRMNFGVHPSKTREDTVKIFVSGSSCCTWNYIFTHSESHDGLVRTRNTNLSTLVSENVVSTHSYSNPGCPVLSSSSSLHWTQHMKNQFVSPIFKKLSYWFTMSVYPWEPIFNDLFLIGLRLALLAYFPQVRTPGDRGGSVRSDRVFFWQKKRSSTVTGGSFSHKTRSGAVTGFRGLGLSQVSPWSSPTRGRLPQQNLFLGNIHRVLELLTTSPTGE